MLHKSIVRPILEYCSNIWFPLTVYDTDEIEKVQRRATKLLPELRDLPYPERLRKLNLHTLKYRRDRNDMLQTFRIIKGIDCIDINDFFELNTDTRTRGHAFKLKKLRATSRQRNSCFSFTVVSNWNALSNEAVSSTSLNAFKTQLDKCWRNNPFKFDPKGLE
jgi:hypothetical protein